MSRIIILVSRGFRRLQASLENLGSGGFRVTLLQQLRLVGELLVGAIQDQLSKGPQQDIPAIGARLERLKLPLNTTEHLRIVTGRLIGSVTADVKILPGGGEVRAGPQRVVYAAIHEFGGIAGSHAAPFEMPARPYASPALEESQDDINAMIDFALLKVERQLAGA